MVETTREEVAPIGNAVSSVLNKNFELENLYRRFEKYVPSQTTWRPSLTQSLSRQDSAQVTPNCNPLTMSLNGAIDAPVNGGIPAYRSAFLIPEFAQQNPQYAEEVAQLQDAIDAQVRIIKKCLDLHGAICPVEIRPLHEQLEHFFARNFATEISRVFEAHEE